MNILKIDTIKCPKCDWIHQPSKSDAWLGNKFVQCRCEKCHYVFDFELWWSVQFITKNNYKNETKILIGENNEIN